MSEGGKKTYYRHGDGEQPNQWFEPVQVWEVKAADLSISPVYTAAIGEVRVYIECVCVHVRMQVDGTGATKHHMCMLVRSSVQLQSVNMLYNAWCMYAMIYIYYS